jgi:hypothetical protein
MFGSGIVRDVILLVISACWCVAIFRRLRRDLETLFDSRVIRDWVVIAALWGVTAVMLVCLVSTSVGVVRGIARI